MKPATSADVLIVADDETEASLLTTYLSAVRMPCSISNCRISAAAGRINDLDRSVPSALVLDPRGVAFSGDLAATLRGVCRTSVIYCSASLESPGLDSLIRETPRSLRVDKRRRLWPRQLLRTLETCLLRQQLWTLFLSLTEGAPAGEFPATASVTADILLLREWLRESPELPDDWWLQYLFGWNERDRRIGSTPLIRSAGIHHPRSAPTFSMGPFEVKFWGAKKRFAQQIATTLLASVNAIASPHELDSRRFRLWVLDPSEHGRAESALYRRLPFLDSIEDPITLAAQWCEKTSPERLEELRVASRHQAMHLMNRLRKHRIPSAWVWFCEAMANWHALRGSSAPGGRRIPACVPLFGLDNRFPALYFLQFLESRLGPSFVQRLWQVDTPDVFGAFEHLGIAAPGILTDFFAWADSEDLLETSLLEDAWLAAASYVRVRLPRQGFTLKSDGGQPHILFRSSDGQLRPVGVTSRKTSVSSDHPWTHALVVNACANGRSQFCRVRFEITSAV